MISLALLCGMSGERDALARAFTGYNNVQIFSGADRLNLSQLVPKTVTRLVDMGLCGGLGPPLVVADVVSATTLRHKTGTPNNWQSQWMDDAIAAAAKGGITVHPVPYYSDGLFNESNTVEERATIYNRYPEHPQAMSDETRFGEALALERHIEFGVIRSLSDDWRMSLPPAATGSIVESNGSLNIGYLILSIIGDPEQIPSLMALEQDYNASLATLETTAKVVAPVLTNTP